MPGRGSAPKDPASRARRNKDTAVGGKTLTLVRAGRQALPDDLLAEGEEWHPATTRWWDNWAGSQLAVDFTTVEWSEMEANAVLHHTFFTKRSFNTAAELRQRMAKLGATPEDRARLRIVMVDADEKETGRSPSGPSSRERRGPLVSVPAAI